MAVVAVCVVETGRPVKVANTKQLNVVVLAVLPEKERKCVVGLEPKRAGVIVAGMLILECVLDVLGQDSFTVSESDILQGVVAALAEQLPPFCANAPKV